MEVYLGKGENVKCPKCGTENREGSKFCKGCGEKLSMTPPPTNVASQPKSSKNTLIICATAIICVLILAGAFVLMNGGSNDSVDSTNVVNDANTVSSVENNEDSSASTDEAAKGKDFTEAASYFSGASNRVVKHVFDECDVDGDGYLTDDEFSNYKDLVAFTKKWAVDIANEDDVTTPDLWNGDGSTRTRYCADHGRIAVGDDDRCPYCEELGYDSRTRSGSTKYV